MQIACPALSRCNGRVSEILLVALQTIISPCLAEYLTGAFFQPHPFWGNRRHGFAATGRMDLIMSPTANAPSPARCLVPRYEFAEARNNWCAGIIDLRVLRLRRETQFRDLYVRRGKLTIDRQAGLSSRSRPISDLSLIRINCVLPRSAPDKSNVFA